MIPFSKTLILSNPREKAPVTHSIPIAPLKPLLVLCLSDAGHFFLKCLHFASQSPPKSMGPYNTCSRGLMSFKAFTEPRPSSVLLLWLCKCGRVGSLLVSLGWICLSQVCLMVGGTLFHLGVQWSMAVPGWCFQLEQFMCQMLSQSRSDRHL